MAVRAYSGTSRPVSSQFEGKPDHRVVEWDADGSLHRGRVVPGGTDGSVWRGYELPDGTLVGSLPSDGVSPARQTALNAATAAHTASEAQIATFKQSIATLAQLVKDNTATAAQQRQLIVKLSRAVLGLLSDAP